MLGSKNEAIYGDLYNIPQEIGTFDVAALGQFLVRNHSGIDVLITEGIWEIDEPAAKFIGRANAPMDFYSNWLYSPSFYFEVVGMLGFRCKSFDRHNFKCNHEKYLHDLELRVFVFERR